MLHAFRDLPEHHVSPVQPLRLGEGEEELRAIRARARVGHGQQPALLVLDVPPVRPLVREAAPVDALATAAVALDVVAALEHEPRDDPVALHALVVHPLTFHAALAFFPRAKRAKVLRRDRECVREQLQLDATDDVILEPVRDAKLQEHLWVDHTCAQDGDPSGSMTGLTPSTITNGTGQVDTYGWLCVWIELWFKPNPAFSIE